MGRIIVLGSLAAAAVASVVLLGVVPNLQTSRSAGCSVSTLQGTYGWIGDGMTIEKGPWAGVGTTTFDGAGHYSEDGTTSVNGNVGTFNRPGAYTVNANCTGTMDLSLQSGITHLAIVITDDGREIFWMVTSTPNAPSGDTWHGIKRKI